MKLKYFLCYTTLVVLISSGPTFAQSDSIRVRVFDGTEQQPTSTAHYDKNFARLNYYLLARGAVTLGIERILHDRHAVSVDAGLTYRDFIYEIMFDEGEFEFEGVDVKVGTYLDLAYKFYPRRYHNFDGEFYLSPGFIARNYNIAQNVTFHDGTISRTQKVDKGYGMREAYLKFGYVNPGLFFDDLILDYYFGFGLRDVQSKGYEIQDAVSGGQRIVPTEKVQSLPAIYMGIKIGFAF